MLKVGVVDDDREENARLKGYLQRFQEEEKEEFLIKTYDSGVDFLEEYKSNYDVIFLDIEMPGVDGMEVAHEIRNLDRSVGIIFVTNMAQYAIRGYEVNAIDCGRSFVCEKLQEERRLTSRMKKIVSNI